MKKTSIILLSVLGICLISFMPSVLGKATSRPIKDFTDTNDYVAAWGDPKTGLTILPHGFFVTDYGFETIADCNPTGFVLVRDLKDGRILYKVDLRVKGALTYVGGFNILMFKGEMDYHFQATMIVYGNFDDPVPNFMQVFFGGLGEGPFVHINGEGTGKFIADAPMLGYKTGDTAKVKVNQIGMVMKVFEPDHPKYYEGFGLWPIELVFFH